MTQNAPNTLKHNAGDASGGSISIDLPRPIDDNAKRRNEAVNIPCYAAYSSRVSVYE